MKSSSPRCGVSVTWETPWWSWSMIWNHPARICADLGPGAGDHGGWLLAARHPGGDRGRPRFGDGRVAGRTTRIEPPSRDRLRLPEAAFPDGAGAREHNLRGLMSGFPSRAMTCVTGASRQRQKHPGG
ncbi:MAG: hypothetical protein R3F31_08105 [Verrucomicrobiales bacterium]